MTTIKLALSESIKTKGGYKKNGNTVIIICSKKKKIVLLWQIFVFMFVYLSGGEGGPGKGSNSVKQMTEELLARRRSL